MGYMPYAAYLSTKPLFELKMGRLPAYKRFERYTITLMKHPLQDAPVVHGAIDARARFEEAAMAGKGRASVNDMKRVEVLVLMEIAQQSKDNGGLYGFSRKTLAERVGVSPYRARAAIERLESEDIIEVVSRYNDDGGQLANSICLTGRGEWYLKGIRAGMLVSDMLQDEDANR